MSGSKEEDTLADMDLKKTKVKWKGLLNKQKAFATLVKKKAANSRENSDERPDSPDRAFKAFKRLKQKLQQEKEKEKQKEEQKEQVDTPKVFLAQHFPIF